MSRSHSSSALSETVGGADTVKTSGAIVEVDRGDARGVKYTDTVGRGVSGAPAGCQYMSVSEWLLGGCMLFFCTGLTRGSDAALRSDMKTPRRRRRTSAMELNTGPRKCICSQTLFPASVPLSCSSSDSNCGASDARARNQQ